MAAAATAADDFNDVFAQMELDVGEANNLRFDLLTSLILHLIASHRISFRLVHHFQDVFVLRTYLIIIIQ